jgi:hypothetical protein
MSLKNRFKTSAALVEEGVWFDVTTNTDKSKCRVKLRRSGRGNKHWVSAFRERTAGLDPEAMSVEEDEAVTAQVFVDACVVDWEHMQPDDDGNELAFSKEAALTLLGDPEWVELLKDWQNKANNISGFQDKREARREGEAGN